jgi:hypothetical protein
MDVYLLEIASTTFVSEGVGGKSEVGRKNHGKDENWSKDFFVSHARYFSWGKRRG